MAIPSPAHKDEGRRKEGVGGDELNGTRKMRTLCGCWNNDGAWGRLNGSEPLSIALTAVFTFFQLYNGSPCSAKESAEMFCGSGESNGSRSSSGKGGKTRSSVN